MLCIIYFVYYSGLRGNGNDGSINIRIGVN